MMTQKSSPVLILQCSTPRPLAMAAALKVNRDPRRKPHGQERQFANPEAQSVDAVGEDDSGEDGERHAGEEEDGAPHNPARSASISLGVSLTSHSRSTFVAE